MEREREEQELQQALAQSLQEQVRNEVSFLELSCPTLETRWLKENLCSGSDCNGILLGFF